MLFISQTCVTKRYTYSRIVFQNIANGRSFHFSHKLEPKANMKRATNNR